MARIIYTLTDEAPLLATYSFLPVVQAYASAAGVDVETRDISLAGRIVAAFGDLLPADQAPIEWGCLRAKFLTDVGARRSELPSRRTGLTALPLTLS